MEIPGPLLRYLLKNEDVVSKVLLDFVNRVKKVKAHPNVKECLEELRQAGANPDLVLIGIVQSYPGSVHSTKKRLKTFAAQLTKLADRLDRISREVEAVVSNPLLYSSTWRVMLVEKSFDFAPIEKRRRGAQHYCKWFEVYINHLRAEAKGFRELIRVYEQANMDDGLGRVLKYVKQSTGHFQDACMAELLQAAYDALGVKGKFTVDNLPKLRRRKLPEMVQKRRAKAPVQRKAALNELYGMGKDDCIYTREIGQTMKKN